MKVPAILLILLSFAAQAAPSEDAMSLLRKGQYSSARLLFELSDDPSDRAYAVLCAGKLRAKDFPVRLEALEKDCGRTVLYTELHNEYAEILFDEGRYAGALAELDKVNPKNLDRPLRDDYLFRRAFCYFELDSLTKAEELFGQLAGPLAQSSPSVRIDGEGYCSTANYYLGYMKYLRKDFDGARAHFEISACDSRLEQVSRLYLVECHFMEKDYGYVTAEGESLFAGLDGERKARLARILSETYLVTGDARKARRYLSSERSDESTFSRLDFFHAGSVLYEVKDYAGAIEKFSRMTDRTDSLGQIANYQMGYSYIRTGNKVAAYSAFNEAAKYSYDPAIREDAAFNFAKLAFDLNHDTQGFAAYIANYSDTRRGDKIYSYMALIELENHEYAAALESYGRMETLDPGEKRNYAKACYLRGGQLAAAGAWSDAIPHLRAAGFNYPRTDPFNQISRYYLAEACYRTDRTDEARKIYADLYNTSALRGTIQAELVPYNEAWCYFRQNSWAQAARWMDIYLGSGSRLCREDALLRRADCDFYRRDWNAAIGSYQKAVDEFGSAIYPLYRQALCYGLLGNNSGRIGKLIAARDAVNAGSQTDLRRETLHELGKAYLDAGDYKSALGTFRTLESECSSVSGDASPDREWVAKAMIGAGLAQRGGRDYQAALESYKGVVSLMPGTPLAKDALTAIESIYQTIGHPELYLSYVQSGAVNRTPEELEKISFDTAEQLYLAGKYKEADELCAKYLLSWPEGRYKSAILFYAAGSKRALGAKEEAADYYAKAADSADDQARKESAWAALASLNFELERFEGAYEAYDRIRTATSLPEARAAAVEGCMRSAWRARDYGKALEAAQAVKDSSGTVEARYIEAKSLLSLSRRDEALKAFKSLAESDPATAEGAEARFILVQDAFDRTDYAAVDDLAYGFAGKCGSQTYWLARAFIVLGESFAARGNAAQARATLESVRDGYSPAPGSEDDIIRLVNEKLRKLE